MNQFLESLAAVVSITYLALTLALSLLPFAVPSYRGLLRTLLAMLLLASPIVVVISLFSRQWSYFIAAIIPIVGLLIVYGPFLLPRRASAASSAIELSVLTFNVQGATESLESLVAILIDADVDIVGIQELSHKAAEFFHAALREHFAYMALYPQDDPIQGQGIFSRYPLTGEVYWKTEGIEKPLGNLRVLLKVSGTSIAFYSAHPTPPCSLKWGLNLGSHSRAVSELCERVKQESAPVIMCGDFNMTDQFAEYGQITRDLGYADAFREAGAAGLGFTFPAGKRLPLPLLVRLDYIFHDRNFKTAESHVRRRSATADHLPVAARLSLIT